MRIKNCLFFILVATNFIQAQESKTILKGKIKANTTELEGIYVINLRNEKSVITEKEGLFSVEAVPGDTLLFSAIHLKQVRIVIEQRDFQEELFLVKMESQITQLKEVVVKKYDNINAVSLGISPKGIKKYTPAERKLATASSMRLNPMGFDPIINAISGRTKMLKKELEVEEKLSFISKIENMFDEDYFKNVLKIPTEYIKGFQYYVVENERFTNVLKSQNKTSIEFLMGELAEKYKELISGEK